jgi:hypothetical protein
MANHGSRETQRQKGNVSALQSQKRGSKAEPKALRQSQNSKIGMGSHQVKKSVKGKSTPARQVHDDADEYAEDEFEDLHGQEDQEPTQSKLLAPKKQIS